MDTSSQSFGSKNTTGKKLDIIRQYLEMYQKSVGSLAFFNTHYVDGFAGTGEITTNEAVRPAATGLLDDSYDADVAHETISGSTELALGVQPAFSGYTFIEKDKKKVAELEHKFSEHDFVERINFLCGDANEMIQAYCEKMHSKDRAIVFLDPFGSQVSWVTIEAIARTKKIDLWYLFPSGVGVYRQISKGGTVHPTHEPSINRLYGCTDWKEAFIHRKPAPTLFDHQATANEKVVNPGVAADFMIERMKSVFQGGVADFKIPLGKHAYPSFHLLFAWGNPSDKAAGLAKRLSKAAIRTLDEENGRNI